MIVGYVGRLAAEKRVDLLAALADLPGVRLAVTGGGPMEEDLRAVLPTATFLGMRHGEDLARIYASLDVFVHTGPFETFGQTVQEAAASGLPVVAPAAGGPLDLVADGVTGYLVAPGDPAALTAAVEQARGRPGPASAVQPRGAAAGARPHLVCADRRAARPLRGRDRRRRAARPAGGVSGGLTKTQGPGGVQASRTQPATPQSLAISGRCRNDSDRDSR